jgi:transcriptional regulator with XRE-family HTH domain
MKFQNSIVMKQPELGIKINEIRNLKGITQKELSEACNIDIRTIQRIECGDVTPRTSTLRLIAGALNCEINAFNGDKHEDALVLSHHLLLAVFVTGIIYLISWILFSPIIPKNSFLFSINLFVAFVYTISSVFFFYGFYNLGKIQGNPMLKISSVITMVLVPLFLITIFIATEFSFAKHLNQLIIVLSGINSIFFGIGLIKTKNQLMFLYKTAGIVQLLIAPFFTIPLPILNLIGCWLTIPFILLLLSIVYLEFRELQNQQLTPEVA